LVQRKAELAENQKTVQTACSRSASRFCIQMPIVLITNKKSKPVLPNNLIPTYSTFPMSLNMKSSPVYRQLQEARSLYDQGKEAHKNENFDGALQFFRRAIRVQEGIIGKYHQDTIKTYWRMGRSACMAEDDRAALQSFQRAVRMAETTFDAPINQSLWKDIESCWSEKHSSTDTSARAAAAYDSSTRTTLVQLAQVLQAERQGDADCKKRHFLEAIESYQRALRLQDSLLGDDSLDGADIRCKLACCFLRMSKLRDAQRVLQTAHQCYLGHFGEQHPATLGAVANMKSARSESCKGAFKKKGWFSASLSSLGSGSKHRSATCV
jgi:tetratricopeptide (TPR) repeat protein